eukprot:2056479-Prymnesium_polylepis.1
MPEHSPVSALACGRAIACATTRCSDSTVYSIFNSRSRAEEGCLVAPWNCSRRAARPVGGVDRRVLNGKHGAVVGSRVRDQRLRDQRSHGLSALTEGARGPLAAPVSHTQRV